MVESGGLENRYSGFLESRVRIPLFPHHIGNSMSIFNPEKDRANKQKISLEDYERRLDERHEEYEKLNEILRGMRSEVSRFMDEIKTVTDDLVKKNAEKFLIEQKIEDLRNNYELLKQNVRFEEETYAKLTEELNKIRNEINQNRLYEEKLGVIKAEYETVSEQLSIEKLELEKIIDERASLIDGEITQLKISQQDKRYSDKSICEAITKNGQRCKRSAIEGSQYCAAHTPKSKK